MAQAERAPLVDKALDELAYFARLKKVSPNNIENMRLKRSIQKMVSDICHEDEMMGLSLQLSLDAIDGRLDSAEKTYQQFLSVPDNELHHNMAMSYIYNYDMKSALDCSYRSFEITPNNPLIRKFYGIMLLEAGRVAEAYEVFMDGLKLKDSDHNDMAKLVHGIYEGVQAEEISEDDVALYLNSVTDFAREKQLYPLDKTTQLFEDEGVSWAEFRFKTGLDFETNDELEDELTDLLIDQDTNPKLMGLINVRFV